MTNRYMHCVFCIMMLHCTTIQFCYTWHCVCIVIYTFLSLQMAEEVMRSGPVEGEEGGRGETGAEREGRAAFEGMEALARAIETGE